MRKKKHWWNKDLPTQRITELESKEFFLDVQHESWVIRRNKRHLKKLRVEAKREWRRDHTGNEKRWRPRQKWSDWWKEAKAHALGMYGNKELRRFKREMRELGHTVIESRDAELLDLDIYNALSLDPAYQHYYDSDAIAPSDQQVSDLDEY